MPKVSVCIPTYNRSHYLVYALKSVLNQSFDDFELIICDDGSIDDTPEIIGNWQDSRIRYIRHPKNIGRSRNMRSGFENASGDYFIKFDDDDALTPDFLAKTVEILDSNNNVDFVCTSHWIIDGNNNRDDDATQANIIKWGKDKLSQDIIPNLMLETFANQSLQVGSTLFRRSCLETVDYMRPEADGCEDFDLLVRLAIAGFQGYFLPELLMEYRIHGGQTSLKQNLHFLSSKVFCIDSYRFPDPELEKLRLQKLASTKQDFGLRLIEKGETEKGRKLLQESMEFSGNSRRSQLGLILSYLPVNLRQFVLEIFRKLKPQDYSDRVRKVVSN